MKMNHRRSDEIVIPIVKSRSSCVPVKIIAATCILAIRQSSYRWHQSCFRLLYGTREVLDRMISEKAQEDSIHEAESSDAGKDGGWCCSSVEAFVMKVERRAPIIQSRTF